MNTRSRRRVTISNSNHPFIEDLLGSENVISKRKVFQQFPLQSSVHSGKFAEVHFSEKPDYLQQLKIVSPLSTLTTPRKIKKRKEFKTPDRKPSKKNRGPTQVRTPNCLHFLARSPNCALKIQRIADNRDIHDKAYHEVLIHKSLAQTAGGCPGFTMLHTWFKSYNNPNKKTFQKPLPKNNKNFEGRKLFEVEDEDEDDDDENREYYMNFVLEKADITLDNYLKKHRLLNEYTFKIVLFQLLFSLQIMQRECGFVHHDLHKKNILIKNLEPGIQLKFKLTDGDEWILRDTLIKITDFGHSRVELNSGHIVYNTSRPTSAIFDASKDIIMIRSNFRGCKVNWETQKTKILKQKLFREMGKVKVTEDIRKLLKHPFFNSLRTSNNNNNNNDLLLFEQKNQIICFEENYKWRKRKKKKKNQILPFFEEKTITNNNNYHQFQNPKNISGKKRKLNDGILIIDFENSVVNNNKKRKIINNNNNNSSSSITSFFSGKNKNNNRRIIPPPTRKN